MVVNVVISAAINTIEISAPGLRSEEVSGFLVRMVRLARRVGQVMKANAIRGDNFATHTTFGIEHVVSHIHIVPLKVCAFSAARATPQRILVITIKEFYFIAIRVNSQATLFSGRSPSVWPGVRDDV